MLKEIELGPEAKAVLNIDGDKVVIGVNYLGAQASAGFSVSLDVEQFGKLLKDAIPGSIDDTVIGLLIAAMKVI